MERWNNGTMEQWNNGTMEQYNEGIIMMHGFTVGKKAVNTYFGSTGKNSLYRDNISAPFRIV